MIFAPLISLAVALLFSLTTPYLYLEYLSINTRYKLRAEGDTHPHEDLLIVGIDEMSLKALGRYPWKRFHYSNLMGYLADVPPKVITYDLIQHNEKER